MFQLKQAVGVDEIRRREEGLIRRAIASWRENPNIEILGNPDLDRLSIVSFVLKHDGRYLHHNFVVALLNDLFGIQSRGGCSCAGPYGHRLLGIDIEKSHEFEREIARGCEGIKPGWVRVNFNYFISEPVFEFIVDAVAFVATDGWKLLPEYRLDVESGMWQHVKGAAEPPLTLSSIRYDGGEIPAGSHRHLESEKALAGYLDAAQRIVNGRRRAVAEPELAVSQDFEHLRWFWLPHEIARTDL